MGLYQSKVLMMIVMKSSGRRKTSEQNDLNLTLHVYLSGMYEAEMLQ